MVQMMTKKASLIDKNRFVFKQHFKLSSEGSTLAARLMKLRLLRFHCRGVYKKVYYLRRVFEEVL